MLSQKTTLLCGILLAGLGVALGAFGAHALKPVLVEHQAVETYALAAQYQFYHALALIAIGILMQRSPDSPGFGLAALLMLAGVILFSGSLYGLALTGSRSVVLLTPLGGVFFLGGWTVLFIAVLRK